MVRDGPPSVPSSPHSVINFLGFIAIYLVFWNYGGFFLWHNHLSPSLVDISGPIDVFIWDISGSDKLISLPLVICIRTMMML